MYTTYGFIEADTLLLLLLVSETKKKKAAAAIWCSGPDIGSNDDNK